MKLPFRHLPIVLIAVSCVLSGCGKSHVVLSGGKPPSYWVASVTSPDAKLRRTAVVKLGNVGDADPAVVPALVGALHDTDPRVRGDAVLALLKAGPAAKQGLCDLEDLARRDRDANVRGYAARAIEKLR